MELRLPIYENKKIIKTYITDTVNCSFGVVEDIIDALNFEAVKTGDKAEITTMVIKCSRQLKPFLKDLFEGLTDVEIRKTQMKDIITLFRSLYQYATNELTAAAGNEKN